MRGRLVLAGILASTALIAAPAVASEWHFDKVATIHLDGATGHGDIVTVDPGADKLYVTNHDVGMNVVDLSQNESIAYLEGSVQSGNGETYGNNYIYVAAGDGQPPWGVDQHWPILNGIVVIDKKTWKEVNFIETQGTTPDFIEADRAAHRLFVDSDDRNWMEVYDITDEANPKYITRYTLHPVNSNHWMGRVSDTLGDTTDYTGPDAANVVPERHEIFQSVDSYVEVLDEGTGEVKRIVDTGVELAKNGGTKAEIYDAKNNRLWVATTGHEMLVMNPDTLQIIKKLPQKKGADQGTIDEGYGLIYAFEGGAQGFDVYDANTMEHVTFVSTGIGQTHTGDVNPRTHRVYAFGGNDRLIYVYMPVRGAGVVGGSTFTVYFEFNKSNLTPDARRIIAEAVASAKQHGGAHIVVAGYTDLAGTAQYNLGLSKRRADAVKAALVADGLSSKGIQEEAFGKTHPAVPTPDGVREPRNRRAVITIGATAAM